MAAGDPQRVWFTEMLVELRRAWSASMTWDELATFCERITVERRALRASRGIEPPTMPCPKCGVVSKAGLKQEEGLGLDHSALSRAVGVYDLVSTVQALDCNGGQRQADKAPAHGTFPGSPGRPSLHPRPPAGATSLRDGVVRERLEPEIIVERFFDGDAWPAAEDGRAPHHRVRARAQLEAAGPARQGRC